MPVPFRGGVSVGPPTHWDSVREALYPDTADQQDFGYQRVARLLSLVAGDLELAGHAGSARSMGLRGELVH